MVQFLRIGGQRMGNCYLGCQYCIKLVTFLGENIVNSGIQMLTEKLRNVIFILYIKKRCIYS